MKRLILKFRMEKGNFKEGKVLYLEKWKAFAEACAMETILIHSGCRGSHAMCQVS